jgi:hypothetical protein
VKKKPLSDSDVILYELRRGGWRSTNALLASVFRRKGKGATIHSRIADLRKRGHVIDCETRKTHKGTQYGYTLVIDAAWQVVR